jgi:predicted DsbA family dithiol-disulfide isomerase
MPTRFTRLGVYEGCPSPRKGWFVVRVEIFSDVVCPWCYIGKRRFEEALESFDHAGDVTVTYRSFQLDPSAPQDSDQTLDEMLAAKYGRGLAEATAMNQRVSDLAATVGLDFQLQQAHPANTFDAHRLLHFAAGHGKQTELKERLLRAYFTEGRRVGDHDVLAGLAAEVGLDRDAAAAVLAGDAFAAEVDADIALARAFGATGVPFFVIDRRYGISGAQETSVFTEVLQKAWDDAHPAGLVLAGPGVDPAAEACVDDSCTVPD